MDLGIFGGFDEVFAADMALEFWLRTWCLKERLESLESCVLWPLCTVEALWSHLTTFGPWGPTPFCWALLFVALMGLFLLTLVLGFL